METNFRYRASAKVATPRIAQKITNVVMVVVTSRPVVFAIGRPGVLSHSLQNGARKIETAVGVLRAGSPPRSGLIP
jgi:hypothetical protein